MTKQTLKVPNKLSEITLGQYQKFSKISTDDTDQDFLNKKTIEIFCGLELKEVNKIKYNSIIRVISVINKMFAEKSVFKDRFEIDDIEYGFIPKLDDMTYGEFVDLDTLMSDWQTMDKAMAVLFRRIKDKFRDSYTIEEYDIDNTDDMRRMPLDIAFGALFFLETLRKELVKHSLNYLAKKSKKMDLDQKEALRKTMDGMLPSIASVKAISQNFQK